MDEIEVRLGSIEAGGSVTARITAADIKWIKEAIQANNKAHDALNEELHTIRLILMEK